MQTPKRICKRCLIRETDQKEVFQHMYTYIAQLDEDIKATSEVYENRLIVCKQCDWLVEGMCGACGCYVEMRAVIQHRKCPYEKW